MVPKAPSVLDVQKQKEASLMTCSLFLGFHRGFCSLLFSPCCLVDSLLCSFSPGSGFQEFCNLVLHVQTATLGFSPSTLSALALLFRLVSLLYAVSRFSQIDQLTAQVS